MKLFGFAFIAFALFALAFTTVARLLDIFQLRGAELFPRIDIHTANLLLGGGFALLVIGCIVYGIGRTVEELQRIRKLLKRPQGPSASDFADHRG